VIAFGLFATVAVQELIEGRLELESVAARAARMAIEEGTELAGILILLKVAMSNTAGLFAPTGSPASPVFEAVHRPRMLAMAVGLAITPALAVVTASLIDQDRGHPADWFSAVIFLAAALAATRRYFAEGADIGWPAWGLAALCLFASVFVVDASADRYVDLGPLSLNLRMLILGGATLVGCGLCTLLPRDRQPGSFRADAAVLATLALLSAFATGLVLVYWLPQVIALAFYFVIRGRGSPPARAASEPTTGRLKLWAPR
jgi:hypothetical protein